MSIRVRTGVSTAISSTTAEDKDLGYSQFEFVSDALAEGGNWKTTLAASATDVEIQLGNISGVKFLALRTNVKNPLDTPSAITVKLNTALGEAISVAPLSDTKEGHFLLTTPGVTGLFLSNPGAVDMEVTIAAAGD